MHTERSKSNETAEWRSMNPFLLNIFRQQSRTPYLHPQAKGAYKCKAKSYSISDRDGLKCGWLLLPRSEAPASEVVPQREIKNQNNASPVQQLQQRLFTKYGVKQHINMSSPNRAGQPNQASLMLCPSQNEELNLCSLAAPDCSLCAPSCSLDVPICSPMLPLKLFQHGNLPS